MEVEHERGQVVPIRLDRVLRQAALGGEVVEELVDLLGQRQVSAGPIGNALLTAADSFPLEDRETWETGRLETGKNFQSPIAPSSNLPIS